MGRQVLTKHAVERQTLGEQPRPQKRYENNLMASLGTGDVDKPITGNSYGDSQSKGEVAACISSCGLGIYPRRNKHGRITLRGIRNLLFMLVEGNIPLTLPQTSIEAEMDPFQKDSSLWSVFFRFHVCLGGNKP